MSKKCIKSLICAAAFMVSAVLPLSGCSENKPETSSSKVEETTEAPKELTLPISSDEALKKNYEDLYDLFIDAGFKNADYDGLGDLNSSSDELNEVIESVTVNGKESFQKGDKILSDAKIMISYHSVKTISLPIDKYDLEKDDDTIYYEDAVTRFQTEGFKDVSTRPVEDSSQTEGMVTDVMVNGESCISDSVFSAPVDAKIVIVYCTKAAQATAKEVSKTENKPESKPESKAESKPESKSIADSGIVTPSFKEMMDSYEAFFDEYIAFMKKYKDNPGDLSLLSEYSDYMSKYSDYMSKLDAVDKDSLSDADLAYYTEVNARILKKTASAVA